MQRQLWKNHIFDVVGWPVTTDPVWFGGTPTIKSWGSIAIEVMNQRMFGGFFPRNPKDVFTCFYMFLRLIMVWKPKPTVGRCQVMRESHLQHCLQRLQGPSPKRQRNRPKNSSEYQVSFWTVGLDQKGGNSERFPTKKPEQQKHLQPQSDCQWEKTQKPFGSLQDGSWKSRGTQNPIGSFLSGYFKFHKNRRVHLTSLN